MPPPPNWWSDKHLAKVSRTPADDPVRVLLEDSVPTEIRIDIFHVPERAVRRLLQHLTGRAGVQFASLAIDPAARAGPGGGVLSETWITTQVHASAAPARFVARVAGFPPSVPLLVTGPVGFEFQRGQVSAALDLADIGAPVPLELSAKTGAATLTGTAFAAVDPSISLRVTTPSLTDPDGRSALAGYLRFYFRMVGKPYGLDDPNPLLGAFDELFGSYLEDDAGLAAEAHPAALDLGAGEEAPVEIQLCAARPGRSLFVVEVHDDAVGRMVATSELIGISVADDGTVYRDF